VKALQLLLAAVPAPRCCPRLRRGNVVGALQLGMRPRPGGIDSRKMLQAAATALECLDPLGSDPIADFPRQPTSPSLPSGARRIMRSTPSSPTLSPRRRRPRGERQREKSGTTTNLEGRVTSVSAR
jgi:NADH-quinone oxidoreductase subunit G